MSETKAYDADSQMEEVFHHFVSEKKLINEDNPSIDIFNIDFFKARLESLKKAFPEDFFLHAMALKGNSFRGVLRIALESGFGGECASIPEALHALSVGFPKDKVVFDSPCKTKADIKTAIEAGIIMNLDNEHEAEMVDELLKNQCKDFEPNIIGMRINPVVGGGEHAILSTATKLSKFGVPLIEETKERIIGLYKSYKWMNGIHAHVGSQGIPIHLFANSVKVVMDFVKEIEAATGRKLTSIDIGGGLSSTYKDSEEPEAFAYRKYRDLLDEKTPELFSGKYKIITEFGRSLLLKAGKSLTRINYIKNWLPEFVKPICLTHLGTNQFIRAAYLPKTWSHRMSAIDGKTGKLKKSEDQITYDVAGPLCFQGDFLGHDVELPKLEKGDIIVVHDTGGYTMSMYSKYNSITPSAVYGYERIPNSEGENNGFIGDKLAAQCGLGGKFRIRCFKERETPEETLAFWGNAYPRIVN